MSKERTRLKQKVAKQPPIDPEELIEDAYKKAKKVKKDNPQWPSPTKPDDVWRQEKFAKRIKGKPRSDIFEALSSAVAAAVQRWNVDYVIADIKYRGVRGVLIIDPQHQTIKILSRKFEEGQYDTFAEEFKDQIFNDLNMAFVDDGPLIVDAELWAQLDDQFLEQGTVTGFIKNPTDPKYEGIHPFIEAFDIYELDGRDLRKLPLVLRRQILEEAISERDVILRDTDLDQIPPTEEAIEKRFRKVIDAGHEGLVIKNPTAPVFMGKQNKWVKLKGADTVDLEVKKVGNYPSGKRSFWFYKHWFMVPRDAEKMFVHTDKGIPSGGFDHAFYVQFTKDALAAVERGDAIASEKTIQVDPSFADKYGVSEVPVSVTFKKGKRPIAEIYAEDVTYNEEKGKYTFPGLKLAGMRDDKNVGDSLADIEQVRQAFYNPEAMKAPRPKVTRAKALSKPKAVVPQLGKKAPGVVYAGKPDPSIKVIYAVMKDE